MQGVYKSPHPLKKYIFVYSNTNEPKQLDNQYAGARHLSDTPVIL